MSKTLSPYYKKQNITLYHGDSLEILRKLPDCSVDMAFADPPYFLSNGGFSVQSGKMVSVNKGDWDRSNGLSTDLLFFEEWIRELKRILKSHASLWISGTYHSIYLCGYLLSKLDYKILNEIIWYKPNAAPNLSGRYFTASHETLIWAKPNKKDKHIFNYDLMRNGDWPGDRLKNKAKQMRSVWSLSTTGLSEKTHGKHPTQKPLKLMDRIILSSTNPADVVLDPFTGSSTTGISAYTHGRNFIGIDIEKQYLDLSIKRFQDILK